MNPTIRRATVDDVDAIAPLFDRYRMFYQQPSDPALAQRFIGERLQRGESVIFLAEVGGKVAGFTQLFPSFSSVRAGRAFVLNDLYVDIAARRLGVARALVQAATDFARNEGAIRLELETDHDNRSAQALYRQMGWELYEGTLRFRLSLSD
ncbi:GNAT family N-acetyltransferase [Pseudoxanthomonas yeongjuensis]|uniref:GNAT family N-acetyltransferase n=1 Tax=Pseudoxanthomonas yeongjuensis TaxID=377616 RepID=UPI0013920A4F|nr:GNAT family N-acetyltransferase [Pseudoxanthomonas yeongjuensis]KAF1714026.1 GNAT family N-acetyltransferase [Pseudoxanthomonas yeongjuensis]